ncbi:MAG: DUF4032 domain-containing protein [Actinomycetota bacterium]|nr:DUF4032 domain-containing protein [Actinomycetota bacterium]
MRIVASRPDPALLALPWDLPLEEWAEHVVPLPRGLSRHVVRIVRLGVNVYAVKETQEEVAFREYRLLRDLQRSGLPAVVPQGVVADRPNELPAMLVTRHLEFALPYRSLFSHGVREDSLPMVVDALVVLLVRLHLSGFYWGDVSLSNVLFRRNAGAFAAYLVDAETGEFAASLSRQMREYDVEVGCENVFGELLDLQAGNLLGQHVSPRSLIDMVQARYAELWAELTHAEEFGTEEMWRIERRVERLNELGFDVDELDIVTDWDGDRVQIQPKVVEAGHHARELQELTGLDVEDNQARRLLNDLASYTAYHEIGGESRQLVANRWLTEIYDPIMELVPAGLRGRLQPAEIFHEILVHRWLLSERDDREWDIFDTARDYISSQLATRPDERLPAVGI